MNWLLKIVEGPMKGAEIALVSGNRVKFGSGEECDIVVADAALPKVAFELDVSDEAVTLTAPDGEPKALRAFEVYTLNTTAVAVGPADGAWQELTYPKPEAEAPAEGSDDAGAAAAEPEKSAEGSGKSSAEPEKATEEVEKSAKNGKKRGFFGFLATLVGSLVKLVLAASLLAIILLVLIVWLFWRNADADRPLVQVEKIPLPQLAAEHGLTLSETNGCPLLIGNLSRRTERLALRTLALATDRRTQFDLTDDETLATAADALLFTVTEGAVKVLVATNRVLEVGGYVADEAALERVKAALRADVPAAREVFFTALERGDALGMTEDESEAMVAATESDAANVTEVTTGTGAVAASGTAAATGAAADSAAVAAADAATVATSGATGTATGAATDTEADAIPGGGYLGASGGGIGGSERSINPGRTVMRLAPLPREFPVAGILTEPYPCVVLRNGARCIEGAQIGGVTLVKIEADRLCFRSGKRTFAWEP